MKTPTKTLVCFLSLIAGFLSVNAQKLVWVKQMGGKGAGVQCLSMTVDDSGNIYTTGAFDGTADFDPGTGIYNLTSAGEEDIFVCKLDASGDFVWAKSMGGTEWDRGFSIAVDDSGNVYITGEFRDTADFDPGAGIYNLISGGYDEGFVIKLNPSGNLIWAKQIEASFRSIAVDVSGNVYTTGFFRGTADFDPGAGTYTITPAGTINMFVSKLNTSGNFVWAKCMAGTSAGYCSGNSIAVDDSSNVYTTGSFGGTVDFDPDSGIHNLVKLDHLTGASFVSKLNASGSFVWVTQIGSAHYSDYYQGNSVAVDDHGNVYTTGECHDGNRDILNCFIEKYNALGDRVWSQRIGTTISLYIPNEVRGNSIAVDTGGNVYTTGSLWGAIISGYSADSLYSAKGSVFVYKLSASGRFDWVIQLGSKYSNGSSIAVDDVGNIYTSGDFERIADFDPGMGTYNLTSAGHDAFVHKMRSTRSNSSILSTYSFGEDLKIYPNPTDGMLYIDLGTSQNKATAIVRNALGQDVLKKSFSNTDQLQLDIPGEAGVYFVEINAGAKRAVVKVLKEDDTR